MTPAQDPAFITWTVGTDDAGKRLDQLVASNVSGCSRNTASRLIRDGIVLVNDEIKKTCYRLVPGDRVTSVARAPEQSYPFAGEPLDIDIIFKDPAFIVINKPPGLVVHPAAGNFSGTLAHGLLYHFPELRDVSFEPGRPGIVHRLDKDTSGVMVIARNRAALKNLSAQFKARTVEKTYTAFVHRNPEQDRGRILLPIYRHPVHRKKMAAGSQDHHKGRYAETLWQVIERYGGPAMLECTIKTGRTHQIRVHLSSVGHPVIGDRVYGYKRPSRLYHKNSRLADLISRVPRQMLHAGKITFAHPETGMPASFTASLPRDMSVFGKSLRAYAKNSP